MTHLTRSRIAPNLLCVGLTVSASVAAVHAGADDSPSYTGLTMFQPEKLDALTAPIALYPDALVLQILECSSSPDQINRLNDWIKENPDITSTAAQDGATGAGFEPSFVAIVLFPQVVKMMAENPDWTRGVAKEFAENRSGVFESIQRLRKQAQSLGNLANNQQQEVDTVTTTSGAEVIVIQPANPQVVYVPQYNPTVVYTQPPPPPTSGQVVGAGLVGFTAGVIIGAAIADDDCGWGYHGSSLCDEGYEEFTEHRENMAAQRGENQSGRQESRNEKQTGRQENQASRQDGRADGSASAQSAGQQAGRGSANESRGSAPGKSSTSGQRAGTSSGAMSGYQAGSKERESSSRGRSSMSSKPSGGARGGGGGGRGGGGRGR